MALDQAEADWIHRFIGERRVRQDFAAKEDQRETQMAQLHAALGEGGDGLKEQIRAGTTFTLLTPPVVTLFGMEFGVNERHALVEEGQQADEIEVREVRDARSLSPAAGARANAALESLTALRVRMEGATLKDASGAEVMRKVSRRDRDGVVSEIQEPTPLFEPNELVDAIYSSAVRERIVSDNLISDAHSEVAQMIGATNKLYAARRARYTDEQGPDVGGLELQVVAKVDYAITIGRQALLRIQGVAGAVSESVRGPLKLDVVSAITSVLTTPANTDHPLSKAACADLVRGVGAALVDVVGGALTGAGLDSAVVATAVSGVAGIQGAAVIQDALLDRPPDVAAAVKELGALLAGALNGGAAVAHGDVGARLQSAGAAAAAALCAPAAVGAIRSFLDQQQLEGVVSGVAEKVSTVLRAAFPPVAGAVGGPRTVTVGEGAAAIVVNLALAAHRGKLAGYVVALVDDVAAALGGLVGGALVMTAFEGKVSVDALVKTLLGSEPDYTAALTLIGTNCGDAIRVIDEDAPAVREVAAAVQTRIAGLASGAALHAAFGEGRYDDAVTELSSQVVNVLRTQPIGDLAATLQTPAAKRKLAENVQNQQAAEVEARDKAERRRLLELTGDDQLSKAASDAVSVAALLSQLAKDRLLIQVAAALAKWGAKKLAEKFFAPLEAVGAGIRFIEAVVQASKRMTALNAWAANVRDARSAQSAYSAAAQNFVGNERERVSHYSIVAALELAEMLGAIAECSVVGAVVGYVVTTGAAAGASAERKLYMRYKEADLERAWKTTAKSLADPTNRRLALEVRRLNPTLAKYCIAYGAIAKRDAIARSCLSACNLDESSLNHPDSGVEEIQHYLEVLYSDDNVVLKKIATEAWVPSPITVVLKTWGAAISRGVKLGGLLRTPTPVIEGALLDVMGRRKAFQQAPGEESAERLLDALSVLGSALVAFNPKRADSPEASHPTMEDFVLDFGAAVFAERRAVLKKQGEIVAASTPEWLPAAPPILTAAAWTAAQLAGKARGSLKPTETPEIDGELEALDGLRVRLQGADGAAPATARLVLVEEWIVHMEALIKGLGGYKPRVSYADKPHAAMTTFTEALCVVVVTELRGAQAQRGTLRAQIVEAERAAEVARIAEEKAAEEAQIAAEKAAEEARVAAEKAAEEARIAEENAAEEARIAAQKAADGKRIAAENAAEEARIAEEKAADEARIAEEKAADEARIAEEKAADEARIAVAKAADEARIAAEKAADEARIAEEKAADEARIAAEKAADEARIAVAKAADEARIAVAKAADEARAEQLKLLGGEARANGALSTIRTHQRGKIVGFHLFRGNHPSGDFILYPDTVDGKPVLLVSSKTGKAIDAKYTTLMAKLVVGTLLFKGIWVQKGKGDARAFTVFDAPAETFEAALVAMKVPFSSVTQGSESAVRALIAGEDR